ncbi:DUF4843 domain-containing protein [Marinifilum sp.]|uniref:DUF4843 domain-containing protein n=1 Tax=Marinifilum sp. TaxID=2033137 RepID=UPI003BAB9ABA
MKKLNIIFSIILLLVFISCDKDEIMTYEGDDYLYFTNVDEDGNYPEYFNNFVFDDEAVTEKNITVPIFLRGMLSNADRNFKISVVDTLTTATEGLHYTIIQNDQIVPANSIEGTASVKVMKTEDMNENEFSIGIQIESNENFDTTANTVVILKITNSFSQPDWWYPHPNKYYTTHIGPYTQTKALLWLEYFGVTDGSDPLFDIRSYVWKGVQYYDPNKFKAQVAAFKRWLENEKGDPTDENGDLVSNTLLYE